MEFSSMLTRGYFDRHSGAHALRLIYAFLPFAITHFTALYNSKRSHHTPSYYQSGVRQLFSNKQDLYGRSRAQFKPQPIYY